MVSGRQNQYNGTAVLFFSVVELGGRRDRMSELVAKDL